jgi:hypothetical protein
MARRNGCCVPRDDIDEVDIGWVLKEGKYLCRKTPWCESQVSSLTAARSHSRIKHPADLPTAMETPVDNSNGMPHDFEYKEPLPSNTDVDLPDIHQEPENPDDAVCESRPEILFGLICLRFSISQKAMEVILELLKMKLDFSGVRDVASVLQSLKTAKSSNHRTCKACDREVHSADCDW